jgi:hypothetical protein
MRRTCEWPDAGPIYSRTAAHQEAIIATRFFSPVLGSRQASLNQDLRGRCSMKRRISQPPIAQRVYIRVCLHLSLFRKLLMPLL